MTAVAEVTPAQRAYRPYGAAEQLMYCRDRVVVLDGPAGTGKTLGVLNKIFLLCELFAGIRVLIVRQTRESLSQTTLELWENEVVPAGHAILTGAKRNIRQSYLFPNKTEVVVGGLDNPDKVLSGQYDIIYIAEAREVSQETFDDMRGRNRRYHPTIPFNQLIMDTNPDYPGHWIKKGWEDGFAGEDGERVYITRLQSTYEDNPKYWDRERNDWTAQGREYVVGTLGSIAQPMKRKRMRFGIWAGAEGAVYDCFDMDRDAIEPIPIPDHWKRYVGLDFGAVNTAACFFALDPDTDLLYLYREYHAGQRTAGQHAHYLQMHEPKGLTVIGGANNEGQWRYEFAAAGLPVQTPTIKAVDVGITRVYGQHVKGNIKVFRTCVGYLAQKAEYRYKADTLHSTAEIENKNAYHFMDAERYAISYLRPERNPDRSQGLQSLPVYTTN